MAFSVNARITDQAWCTFFYTNERPHVLAGFLLFTNSKEEENFIPREIISSFMFLLLRKYCNNKQKLYPNSVVQYTIDGIVMLR